ncbi:protein EPIDERMAL PATTERNING FACTOR 1 [Magnolia sinica]|uniref:protein EPIDERMAL PATTERNING FACTOR 1 n=1 Tax=Magnolia sinica TaxID=86752 RepID=UPI00265B1829|nr:protein EPIDERMAL PATTERNING FACTOR 1 [Magnolia sinica]
MRFCMSSAVLLGLLLLLPMVALSRSIGRSHSRHSHHHPTRPTGGDAATSMGKVYYYNQERRMRSGTLEIAGSRLPDCSHACGSCKPCRLVMVSFMCASLEEAETCPMAYKCMCNSKSYPVP